MAKEKSIEDVRNECPHLNFDARVSVGRLAETDDGPIRSYTAEVEISCKDCGRGFEFCGVPIGTGGNEPRVSPDGLELRVPLMPAGNRLPASIPGVRMTFERSPEAH